MDKNKIIYSLGGFLIISGTIFFVAGSKYLYFFGGLSLLGSVCFYLYINFKRYKYYEQLLLPYASQMRPQNINVGNSAQLYLYVRNQVFDDPCVRLVVIDNKGVYVKMTNWIFLDWGDLYKLDDFDYLGDRFRRYRVNKIGLQGLEFFIERTQSMYEKGD